jgi:hypothetical protein
MIAAVGTVAGVFLVDVEDEKHAGHRPISAARRASALVSALLGNGLLLGGRRQ